jgi:hypothetical protein
MYSHTSIYGFQNFNFWTYSPIKFYTITLMPQIFKHTNRTNISELGQFLQTPSLRPTVTTLPVFSTKLSLKISPTTRALFEFEVVVELGF